MLHAVRMLGGANGGWWEDVRECAVGAIRLIGACVVESMAPTYAAGMINRPRHVLSFQGSMLKNLRIINACRLSFGPYSKY